MSPRSYDQYCPVAVGLDVLGDRWTLLILREVLIGDQRFTDLRAALPGLAPNLLTERLRELEAHGLVARKELPPPAARTVYSATPSSRDVIPVLHALARFGAARLAPPADRPVRPATAVYGLLVPFHRAEPGAPRLHVRLVLDGSSFDLVSERGRLSTRRRETEEPDLVLTGEPSVIVDARQGGRSLREAIADGDLELAGTRARWRVFEQRFDLDVRAQKVQ